MSINYYKVSSTYFLIFICISALGAALLPALFNGFSSASDDFAKSKMEYLKTELILSDENTYNDPCSKRFLVESVRFVERDVVCVVNKEGSRLLAYIELNSGWFYVVDSDGVSCSLPERPKFQAINCKQANVSESKLAWIL